jgi:hypothetical protein
MLALDQVLRKHWSYLAHFWTSTRWSKKERLGRDEIADVTYFVRYVDLVRGDLGFLI